MHGGRTDASTSTDDIKGRPLCLFYFSHPFGVLSPEPPAVAAAPPHLARAFFDGLHMSPPPCRRSPDSDDYGSSSASRPAYDLGDAAVYRNPVLHNYTLDFAQRDSVSSSLFSGDMWFSSSASSRKYGAERRVIPYNKILPPLRLPTPRDVSWDSSDDVWPQKCLTREKFSLPPIELPCSVSGVSDVERVVAESESGGGSDLLHVVRCRRTLVNRHRRRARLSGVQRMVTCLMKRTVKGFCSPYVMVTVSIMIMLACPACYAMAMIVPLRPAVFVIAVLGLLWGGAFIFAFTDEGAKQLAELGLPEGVADVMRYVHGGLGVLLVAVHLLLIFAAIFESDSLCEVYLWFMVVFWLVLVVAAMVVAVAAVLEGNYAFAGIYFLVMLVFLLISIYFAIIVGNYRMTVP